MILFTLDGKVFYPGSWNWCWCSTIRYVFLLPMSLSLFLCRTWPCPLVFCASFLNNFWRGGSYSWEGVHNEASRLVGALCAVNRVLTVWRLDVRETSNRLVVVASVFRIIQPYGLKYIAHAIFIVRWECVYVLVVNTSSCCHERSNWSFTKYIASPNSWTGRKLST